MTEREREGADAVRASVGGRACTAEGAARAGDPERADKGSELPLSELIDAAAIQSMMEDFYAFTGLPLSIIDLKGKVLVGAGWQEVCTHFHRKNPETLKNCLECDTELSKGVAFGAFKSYVCKNGLRDFVTPLVVAGQHVGNLFTGQLFYEDEVPDASFFQEQAARYGFDACAYLAAARRVPVWKREAIQSALGFYSKLASLIARLGYEKRMALLRAAERKRMEASLRKNRAILNAALSSTTDAVFISDAFGTFIHFNNAFATFHRFKSKQECGRKLTDYPALLEILLPSGEAVPLDRWAVPRALRGETAQNVEFILVRKDTGETWIGSYSFSPIRDKRGAIIGAVVTARDVSEQKRVESELLKMRKLQSVATLAGGIAHDFNNILLGLFGNLTLAKEQLGGEHPSSAYLAESERSMSRAVRLTKQLLTFSKGGSPVKESISLGPLVEEVVRFDLSGSNVRLEYRLADELWDVAADTGQLQQVISNLTINARQAMPQGGCLHVSLANEELGDSASPGLQPGRYVKVTVRDEGVGMAPEVMERIFDPYFTTKASGSGLGLAMVYSIVGKHGGHIGVESEPGVGTCFTLYLPASRAAPAAPAVHVDAAPPPERSAKILVMDDEEAIRKLAARMLAPCGYSVVTVADGKAAIDVYRESLRNGEPFDAVIMDLTVPGGVGGREAIRELLAVDPHVKAIVSSGYAEDTALSSPSEHGFRGVAAKPYTQKELRDVVARVLR